MSIHVGIESESIWKVLATVLLHRGVSCRSRRLKPPFTSKYIGQFLHKCAIKTQRTLNLRLWFCLRVLFSGFYCNFQQKLIVFPNVLKLETFTLFSWSAAWYAGLYISIENLYYSVRQSWNETTFPNFQINIFFIILVTKAHHK